MTDKKLKEAQFEAMLRMAVIENFEEEITNMPPRDEMEKMYTFSERHIKRMRKLFARVRRMDIYKKMRKISYRAAVVLLITISLAFGALMLDASVRAAVSKTLIEWFNSFTRFSFSRDSDINTDIGWFPSYLPEGYFEANVFIGGSMTEIEYINLNDSVITFKYMPASSSTIGIDNEHSNYSLEMKDDIEFHIFDPITKNTPTNIIWEDNDFIFLLEALCDREELMKIAVSIKEK